MEPAIIGIKQLHKDLTAVAEAAARGKSFVVVRHAKPVFRIEPMRSETKKTHTLEDVGRLGFHSHDKKMSKMIDQLLYAV